MSLLLLGALAAFAAGACTTVRGGAAESGTPGPGDVLLWVRPEPPPESAAALAGARQLLRLGRPADAFRAIEAVLGDGRSDFLEGERFLQDLLAQSQSDEWLRVRYEARLAARPDDADSWYLRARIEPSAANQARGFEEALRREPAHAYARLGRAICLERAGHREAAAEEARSAAASAPWLALPWLYLGSSLASRGDDAGAVACYQEAAARDGDDPRPRIGLVAAHDDAGRAEEAARAALDALRCAPGDPGVLFGCARVLERRGSEEHIRRALALIAATASEAGDRAAIAAFRGRCLLALGDAHGAAEDFAAAAAGGWSAEVEAISRRALVADGRTGEAIETFLSALPEEASGAHPLREFSGRRPLDFRETLALARALVRAGWLDEAALVLRTRPLESRYFPGRLEDAPPALARELEEVDRFRAFLREVADYGRGLRRRARRGSPASLGDLLEDLRRISVLRLGRDVFEGAAVRSYAPLGEFVVSTAAEGPFRDEFLARGLVVVAGRRAGSPADFFVSRLVRHDPVREVEVLGERVAVDEHWVESDGLPEGLAGLRGGLAGLTLDRWVFVQLDAVRRRARVLEDGLPFLRRAAATPEDLRALDTPSLVARRIEIAVCGSDGFAAVLDAVRRHEYVHALDASRTLPVFAHPLRNLGFAISHGFDAASMERTLEARAALGALADSSDPRPALAALVSFLPAEESETPHAAAYRALVAEAVEIVLEDPASFPSIDLAWNVIQQFDRLTRAEARLLARRLLRVY